MRAVLVDVKNCDVREIECNNLDDYYNAIDCNTIDIVSRRIGDGWYDIIVDDEGLLADNPIPSALDVEHMTVMLVGNLIISKHDGAGNEISLDDDNVDEVMHNIVAVFDGKSIKPMLMCKYN